MTTTVFYVRHVPHEFQDRVQVGRSDNVKLGADAPARLARLRDRFAGERLDAVYASPIFRAQETAKALAGPLPVQTLDELNEINAGDWTGLGFAAVQAEPSHALWNERRSLARIPGGESMLEVEVRMMRALEAVRRDHPDGRVAVVSHGDPIKSALLYLLGMPLDGYSRIEVEPGSISTVVVGDWGSKLLRLNETVFP